MRPVTWRWYAWNQLDPDTLYALLRLRSDVFVVEQQCLFLDMDGVDPSCEHLCGWDGGKLLACLRLAPPGVKAPQPVIGRLVVAPEGRGAGLARAAMLAAIERSEARFGGQEIAIAAQQYLQAFYESLGFAVAGDAYLEDGIPHVNMVKAAAAGILRR